MPHPPPFRVPSDRPSIEQTAKELGVAPSEFVRITKMVDMVLSDGEGSTAAEHKTVRAPTRRRAMKKSRARTKRQSPRQQAAKRK